ncbi:hypothetical protein JCM33774_30480 [Actinophytocola sp. KF-1]
MGGLCSRWGVTADGVPGTGKTVRAKLPVLVPPSAAAAAVRITHVEHYAPPPLPRSGPLPRFRAVR